MLIFKACGFQGKHEIGIILNFCTKPSKIFNWKRNCEKNSELTENFLIRLRFSFVVSVLFLLLPHDLGSVIKN